MSGEESGGRVHIQSLRDALATFENDLERLDAWGGRLAVILSSGGRLLACGNGGSAALASHLSAELVGRYRDERAALSAIALAADAASLTAVANDYGAEEVFARQVAAHGRERDVLMLLSTSGRSANLLAAVAEARRLRITTWGLTGPRPNPLADACDECIAITAPAAATVQEVHQVAVHILCAAIDAAFEQRTSG